MALIFHVRGDSLDARYARGKKRHSKIVNSAATPVPAILADASAGVFGGSLLGIAHATDRRALSYLAFENWSANLPFSVLIRPLPRFTGFPSGSNQGLFYIGDALGQWRGGVGLNWNTDGKLSVQIRDYHGNIHFGGTTTATLAAVSGSPMDIMLVYTGTNAADGLRLSVSGVEFELRTTALAAASRDNLQVPIIMLGVGSAASGNVSNFDVNEFAIWDSVEPHVYAARTDFITSTVFDGDTYTVPAAEEIKHGVVALAAGIPVVGTYRGADLWDLVPVDKVDTGYAYLADGEAYVGDSNDPDPADVKAGVIYDNETKSGTYTASERWAEVPESKVEKGYEYLANGVEKTGTLRTVTIVADDAIAEG